MRTFAELYRLSHSRLQHKLKTSFTGLLRDGTRGSRNIPPSSPIQAERSHQVRLLLDLPGLAQYRAEEAKAAKGRPSVVTNLFAERLDDFPAQGLFVATYLSTHASTRRLGKAPVTMHGV